MWDKIKSFFRTMGPGLTTGAADEDPSGIATYSQAGAAFGYAQLWIILILTPMMIAVQEMCARIGIVKRRGLAGVIKQYYPRWILYGAISLMVVANTVNLAADLSAMSAALGLIVKVPHVVFVVVFAAISLGLQMFVPYSTYSKYLRYLAIALITYVITGFVVHHNWLQVLRGSLVPSLQMNKEFLMLTVGVMGTTISPFLFFWQASQEVEEMVEAGLVKPRETVSASTKPPRAEGDMIPRMKEDTISGMIFAEITDWFVVLTAAGALHARGVTNVQTAADAAKAIAPAVHFLPNSGKVAEIVFAVGIIGLGMIAVPVFTGANAYALSETFGWPFGFYRKIKEAWGFFAVMALGMAVAVGLDVLGVSPIKALVLAAVINGITAPPLIFLIMRITRRRDIVGRFTNPLWITIVGWITFGAMTAAAVAYLVLLLI